MNKKDTEIFRHLMARYKDQWDRNQYARDNYDEDLEYYLGYRNKTNYPLAYNETFNRILPIIYTILSRFMDQMFQTSNIVSVRPRKSKDVLGASAAEATLNFQLENLNSCDMQGGAYLTFMKMFFNILTFGKGISKVYWRKDERITPRRVSYEQPNFDRLGNFQGMDQLDSVNQEMQTTYDGPYMEVLHNKTFVPHPQYRNIQQMPAVFLVYKKSIDHLHKMAKQKKYKNMNEIGWDSGDGAGNEVRDSNEAFIRSLRLEGGLTQEEIRDDIISPEVDIIECYTKLIMKDNPYEVGSGYKIKGEEKEAIVHIGNYRTILSIQENPYGVRPLFDAGCYMQPELYWDLGMIRLTKGLQEQINNLGNLRMQNAMMLVNNMIKVRSDADIDPNALTWRPFGIVPVEEMDDVQPLTVPDYNGQIFQEQEKFYESTIQDLTGMYAYNMGQTPTRQERVGVVHSISSMGEARAKLMLMSIDYTFMRPLLKHLMLLNTYHLPSGFEYRVFNGDKQEFGQIQANQIHPEYDFMARYTSMEPALGKQFRAQQLLQMAGMWQENPWINQHQMIKTIAELLDIHEADSLIKTPEQFKQEREQEQKQEMMMESAKMQAEQQGKMQRDKQHQDSKTQQTQMKIQADMAKQGQKQEGDAKLELVKGMMK